MGTTAEKLTYLNDTKQLLKENINSLGGNLTTEPFRQYASVLEGIYESLPKVSGIGASLSLSPSMVGKIKLNEIQGDTLQDGTPTPSSPIPIENVTGLQNIGITGKNLFDMSTAVQSPYGYHNNTGTLTHIDNNTIKIVKGNTSTDARMSVANNINISSGTTISVSWEYGTGNGNVVGQIQAVNNSGSVVNLTSLNNSGLSSPQILTLTDDIKYIYLGTAWNNHSDLVVKNIQIEKNNQATTYESYKGNTYEVNLGKNLFNVPSEYLVTTQEDININIPTGTYTISATDIQTETSSNAFLIQFTYFDNTTLNYYVYFNDKKATITLTKNVKLIRIYSGGGYNQSLDKTTTFTNLMIEKGSNATSYSPYFTPIELNKIGNYKDSIKKSTGKNLNNGINQYVYLNGECTATKTDSNYVGIYIPVNGGNYTISTKSSQTRYRVACSHNIPTSTASNVGRGVNKDGTSDSITINTTGYEYLLLNVTDLSNIQIEQGSSATSYEPYGKVWYTEKKIGKVVLNGSNDENWNLNTTRTNTVRYRLPNTFNNMERVGYDYNTYCNYATAQNVYSNDVEGYFLHYPTEDSNSTLYFSINKSTASTLEQLKNWLSTHNTEIIYPLATPTYTEITNTELIEQLESLNNAKSEDGTTNINVTSEDLSMILNVGVLKGE